MALERVDVRRAHVRAAMRTLPSGAWRWLFAASVAVVGIADAIVLDLVKAYFGSGYNGVALHGFSERATFFTIGALFDGAAISAVWCATLAFSRVIRARPLYALALASFLGVSIPLAFDLAIHRLHRVLGDVLELGLLLDLAAGSWGNALGEAAQDLPPLALLGAACVAAIVACYAALARIERTSSRFAAARLPPFRTLAAAFVVFMSIGAGALAWSAAHAPALEFGWSAKPSGRALRETVAALSDVDRDGSGWLSTPPDPAPFDATVHPYAIDIPGNGIDEDGVAGDLLASVGVPQPVAVPIARAHEASPSVVLIFLESFRADLVGLRLDGREVTPNLNRLAARGTHATAYAHVPVTWASRASLLQGEVVPTADGTTLVDDFLERGYEVAWFSGQHDGLAGSEARLGLERAGTFYDARADVARRTSRSAQPISLQVSWKTVVAHIQSFLGTRDAARPLFLYVNVVDTHFPYWHSELDDILGAGVLPRSAIRPENRERVWRAYANAAANVDRAIGELMSLATEALGPRTLFVVTGDHGQSFYENGLLGHGQSLDDSQTSVPLVVGVPQAELPSPVALSDLRGLIGHWVDHSELTRAELGRAEVFQHLGDLRHPKAVALRTRDGIAIASPTEQIIAPGSAAVRAVTVWETLNLRRENAKRRRY